MRSSGRDVVAGHQPVLLREIVHREVYAVELAVRDVEVTRHGAAAREAYGVELACEIAGGHGPADVDSRLELHALLRHLVDAPLDYMLFELEVGYAEAEEAAYALGALEYGHVMSGPVQLLSGGESGRARSDDGDPLACTPLRGPGHDPAVLPASVRDRLLDVLDGHGVLVDGEDAGGLARRGTDPSGELREVVGRVESFERVLPLAAVDEVVPVGDEVAEGQPS